MQNGKVGWCSQYMKSEKEEVMVMQQINPRANKVPEKGGVMKSIDKIRVAYTHAGVFHADDVFAAAFLTMINPKIEVVRTNTPPEEYGDDILVFDIGRGKYDHHEESDKKEKRDNGVPYAAFGKLWRDYSYLAVSSDEVAKTLDRDFVEKIDFSDNTGAENTLCSYIAALNPTWDEDASSDDLFMSAVEEARKILGRLIVWKESENKAREIVLASKVDEGILVLKRFVPWKETVVNEMPDVNFVVYPSSRGGYNVQTVPVDMESKEGRVMFPVEWLGRSNDELGITFCHPGNFLLSTDTLDQAVCVAKKAKKNWGKKY